MSYQQDHNFAFASSVQLSIMHALFGEVTSNLRAVGFKIIDKEIKIFSYYDGLIDEDTEEDVRCMETEVISDFWQDYDIHWECKRADYPKKMKDIIEEDEIKHFVYRRKEIIPD